MPKHKNGRYSPRGLLIATAASAIGAIVVVQAFRHFLPSRGSGFASTVARPAVFAGVWTAITTTLGMRAFSERIQRWRQGIKGSGDGSV